MCVDKKLSVHSFIEAARPKIEGAPLVSLFHQNLLGKHHTFASFRNVLSRSHEQKFNSHCWLYHKRRRYIEKNN